MFDFASGCFVDQWLCHFGSKVVFACLLACNCNCKAHALDFLAVVISSFVFVASMIPMKDFLRSVDVPAEGGRAKGHALLK